MNNVHSGRFPMCTILNNEFLSGRSENKLHNAVQIRICTIVHCKAFFRWSQECAARKVFKAFLCSPLGSSSKTHSFLGCSFHITIVITGFRGVVSPLTRTGCDWGGGGVERVCVGVCGDVGVGGWRGAYESRPMKGRGFSCLSTACTIGL